MKHPVRAAATKRGPPKTATLFRNALWETAGGCGFQPRRRMGVFGENMVLRIVDGEDCREIVERYSENGESASIRPAPRGGCRPEEYGLWIASAERKERAAGGVMRMAVDAGFRMVHPQRDCFACCRWKVVLAATADRSTPPVAALAACLLPCIRLPFMAAPPPLSEGGVSCRPPCALHGSGFF